MTADGAVPIHCKIHDGNTSDDSVHRQTWMDLCDLVGSSDFLYVADSKLCSKDNMSLIAQKNGRFLTVMPRTRAEDVRFRDWVRHNSVNWSLVYRQANPRGKDKPEVVYHGFEDTQGSQEGYRILWYLSSQKQQRDQETRQKKLHKTRKRLEQLRPRGCGQRSPPRRPPAPRPSVSCTSPAYKSSYAYPSRKRCRWNKSRWARVGLDLRPSTSKCRPRPTGFASRTTRLPS